MPVPAIMPHLPFCCAATGGSRVRMGFNMKKADTYWMIPIHSDYLRDSVFNPWYIILVKITIHSSSCEIEDFVETHRCKLCVI